MANKVYKIDETSILFGSEVGDDVAWSSESITDGNGRQSAAKDLGAGGTARSRRYMYRCWTQCQATPTVGNIDRLYLKTGEGTAATDHHDNDDGVTDIAVSAEDKLRNLRMLKPIIVDQAAANIEFVSSGEVEINERAVSLVEFNETGATKTTDAAETKFRLTPVPPEIQ